MPVTSPPPLLPASPPGEVRAAKGLNQQGLGSLVGASRQTISLIERGDYNPSITLALRIAKVFGTTVDEVFYLTEEDEEQ